MQKRKSVSVPKVLADIGAGATEFDLQEKYGCSPGGLEKLLKRLVAEKHIGKEPLIKRFPKYESKLVHIRQRRKPRSKLEFALPAYDLRSQESGLVRDLSEAGLRLAGIECEVGELKSLQIQLDRFMNVDPMLLLARCRWRRTRGKRRRYVTGGFEITTLPVDGEVLLKKLLNCLVLNPSLKLHGLMAEQERRMDSSSYSEHHESLSRVQSTSSRESKEVAQVLPKWIDLEALKALQEVFRSGTLHQIIDWWEARKIRGEGIVVSHPEFSGKRRFLWVHLNEEILQRALKKVSREGTVGFGGLSPVIEELLWEFIGRPKDVLQKGSEQELR